MRGSGCERGPGGVCNGCSSIYFTSDRDGYRCIFRQSLNTATKQPVAEPLAVYHSHEARRSLLNAGSGNSEIAVGLDRIVFLQTELSGNVWIASPRVMR